MRTGLSKQRESMAPGLDVIDVAAVFGIGVDEKFLDRHRSANHPLLVALINRGADGVTGEVDEGAGR
jgi:hypothetical protein